MPELPEVETIRRGLKKFILHQKIQKVQICCEKSFQGNPKSVEKSKIIDIRRYGKALILDFDNQYSLMIHLRMTGQLIYDGKKQTSTPSNRYAAGHPSDNFTAKLPNKQTRVILMFENGTLYFNDQRKFGFIKVLKTIELEDEPFIKKLAKEPWEMMPDEFYQKLQKHPNSLIKAVILDQTVVCGLGNIYADESLFMSGIHPKRKAGSISEKEAEKLLLSAREVMEKSIASGGSTMQTYVKADGTKGDYLDLFAQVFHKEGQPCPKCRSEIVKIRVAGRGTHLCPKCQILPDEQSSTATSGRKGIKS